MTTTGILQVPAVGLTSIAEATLGYHREQSCWTQNNLGAEWAKMKPFWFGDPNNNITQPRKWSPTYSEKASIMLREFLVSTDIKLVKL